MDGSNSSPLRDAVVLPTYSFSFLPGFRLLVCRPPPLAIFSLYWRVVTCIVILCLTFCFHRRRGRVLRFGPFPATHPVPFLFPSTWLAFSSRYCVTMVDCGSDRQYQARCAYGNPEKSIEIHGAKMETFNVDIRKNGAMRNRAMVLSGLAGLCTAAGAVAVAVGAPQLPGRLRGLRDAPCMALWTAAGGLCLAYVSTSSFSFERAIYDLEYRREMWEIENHLSGEVQEMLSIYKSQGLTEEEALIVTRIFARQKTVFANLMMVEELGYSRLEPPTTSEAVTNVGVPAVMGFVIGVATPLLCLAGALRASSCGQSSSMSADCGGAVPGPSAVTTQAKLLGAGIFCMCTAVLSYVQTEVFFGAYAHAPALLHTTVSNAAGIGSVFGLSYLAARLA